MRRKSFILPFAAEPLLVGMQQFGQIHAVGAKRCGSLVVDVDVFGNGCAIAGMERTQAKVIVLEVADTETLIEQSDARDDGAPEHQAEADQA